MNCWTLCRAAGAAALIAVSPPVWAAAPDDLDAGVPAPQIDLSAPAIDYALETEMVVHNWILCVSQPVAEQLVRAREQSVEIARMTYADLASERSCGQFPELRVILRDRVYVSAADAGYDARIFGALVNLSGDWASAFVVSGGLPAE